IMFAERARELASLRVLGFKKSEIAYILFGELGLLIVVAIPFAWAIGVTFAWLLTTAMSMDLFRIPFILSSTSFAMSALGVLAAATLSILLMLRRVWQLDMIQALKTE
ncbi:MAG: FtsX-like permease family protein, partial [Gammaproteobacteria bacterium]|nr:FtsX-like permease family protein [Gammaproteobacteria bacterium]